MFNDLILGMAVIGLFVWIMEFANKPTWVDIIERIKKEQEDE